MKNEIDRALACGTLPDDVIAVTTTSSAVAKIDTVPANSITPVAISSSIAHTSTHVPVSKLGQTQAANASDVSPLNSSPGPKIALHGESEKIIASTSVPETTLALTQPHASQEKNRTGETTSAANVSSRSFHLTLPYSNFSCTLQITTHMNSNIVATTGGTVTQDRSSIQQQESDANRNPSLAMMKSASLYVGDLHKDTNEQVLFELFQGYGVLQSVRICRDLVTAQSLCYGYVNFTKAEDAKKAMEERNCYSSEKTGWKALRVMWKNRDPSLRRSGAGNVFVKNLHAEIDNRALLDTFVQFGTVLSSKVAIDGYGRSLGHGFVHFESPHAADEAIRTVNGMELIGKKVYVGKFIPKSQRKSAAVSRNQFTNIYVKDLDVEHLSDAKLRELFSAYAPITSIHIPTTAEGTPIGYAFVNFQECEKAERAVTEMNGKRINERALYVSRAQKRSERAAFLREQYTRNDREKQLQRQGRNLYVKHLSPEVDKAALENHFSQHGTIESCIVVRDRSGVSRGFGFVCFTARTDAIKAMNELHGTNFGTNKKPIYVALAQRKDERSRMMQTHRSHQFSPHNMAHIFPMQAVHPTQSMHWVPYHHNGHQVSNFISMHQNINNVVTLRGAHPGSMQVPYQPMAHPVMGISPQAQQFYSSYYDAMRQRYAAGNVHGNVAAPVQNSTQAMQASSARTYATVAAHSMPQQSQNNAPEPVPEPPTLTADVLAAATPDQRICWLGKKLHPLVSSINPSKADKITGMLLEWDFPDILELLDDRKALEEQVSAALKILDSYTPGEKQESQKSKGNA